MKKHNSWTPEEVKTLIRKYPTTLTAELAEEMGRDVMDLYRKANKMLLPKIFRRDLPRRNGKPMINLKKEGV